MNTNKEAQRDQDLGRRARQSAVGEADSSWRGWLRESFMGEAGFELGLAALGSFGPCGDRGRGGAGG